MGCEDRYIRRFLELASIQSPSGRERDVANYCRDVMESFGVTVHEDDTGHRTGGNAGNLTAFFDGDNPDVPVIMLNAHLDTVDPGGIIEPEIRDGRIISKGNTILGADNKAGLVMILEGMAAVLDEKIPHGGIEIVLTVGEEVGLIGALNLDYNHIKAKFGFSFDSSGLGRIVQGAPFYNAIDVVVTGRAAHAGVNPSDGINSIKLTTNALSHLEFGMIDQETTANIGMISGGTGRNVVPAECRSVIEIRSHSLDKLENMTHGLEDVFNRESDQWKAIVEGRCIRPAVNIRVHREFDGFCLSDSSPVVRCAASALASIGRDVTCYRNMGGSDANVFNARGIPTAIVGTGQMAVHSNDEYIEINDLIEGVQLIPEIVKAWNIWWTQKIT